MSTKRYEVNHRVALALHQLRARVAQLLDVVDNGVSNCNFDLREISNKDGYHNLQVSIMAAKDAKKLAIECRKSIEDVVFNLDHYITRNAQDLKKVRGRLDGEATEA